jgi:hypothetical protein
MLDKLKHFDSFSMSSTTFVTNSTHRINLPIGAAVVIVLVFILQTPPCKNTDSRREQLRKLDPWGTMVFLPGIVCLLLALQWGGTTYAWENARIIVLFILAFLLLAVFMVIQFKSGDYATIPIRIIEQRSVASATYMSFIAPGAMFVIIYFVSLKFLGVTSYGPGFSWSNTVET